jgi:hypothetical protein
MRRALAAAAWWMMAGWLAAAAAFPSPCSAASSRDQLLVVVSAQKFGAMNPVLEAALGSYVARGLRGGYRKAWVWKESAGIPAADALRRIVAQRAEGERLDVFAVHHGPDYTFMPGLSDEEAERLLPRGFVRRVISTACSQWGRLSVSGGDARVLWQSSYSEHLERLGVEESISYANDTGAWFWLSVLLPGRLSAGGSWLLAAPETLATIDRLSREPGRAAEAARRLPGLLGSLYLFVSNVATPSISARPVLGAGEAGLPAAFRSRNPVAPLAGNGRWHDFVLLPPAGASGR